MFKFNGNSYELCGNFDNKNTAYKLLSEHVKPLVTGEDWNYDLFYKAAKKAKEYGDIYIMNGIKCVPCGGALVAVEVKAGE